MRHNDLHDGNVMSTHFLIDRQFTKEVLGGVMAAPIIRYYGVDTIDNELAKQAGKFYWCREAKVNHLHPANGKREVDDTDKDHMDFWIQDQATLDGWRSRGRKIEWESVI